MLRVKKHSALPKTTVVLFFAIFTSMFGLLFSTITEGAMVASPHNHLAVKSTSNTHGTSGPTNRGVLVGSTPSAGSAAGSGAGAIVTIPGKPAWLSLPLYVDPTNEATLYANANPTATGVNYISRMGGIPVAEWFGDWNGSVQADANAYVSAATAAHAVPILVAYNIPNRDCGGYSVGGASAVTAYTQWVQQLATGIGNRTAVVILEPDALGALDCLPAGAAQDQRLQAISQAVPILKAHAGTYVYIDAGTPFWQPADVMATRLTQANVAAADGFSIDVSYFATTAQNRAYGDKLSAMIGYKHYVIDTSRNGTAHTLNGAYCNPSFASFGQAPTTNTGSALNDALLWIKIPWESDGQCGSSPGPGQVYWSYAIQLAQNAGW